MLAGEGATDKFGNMTLSALGSEIDRSQVLLHETVHSFLSPDEASLFSGIRADSRMWLYQNSNFFRYTEEALAESVAQVGTRQQSGLGLRQALWNGIRFPTNPAYQISYRGLLIETVGGASAAGGGIYGANKAGQYLLGDK